MQTHNCGISHPYLKNPSDRRITTLWFANTRLLGYNVSMEG
jgi:hypothetical protein